MGGDDINDLDPATAIAIVTGVIQEWLTRNGAGIFQPDKTIPDLPPKGYAISPAHYENLCTFVEKRLAEITHRRVVLDRDWRDSHYNTTMGSYRAAVVVILLHAPPVPPVQVAGP
ncbi:MAG TPA: hypothetical protein VN930_01795 [Xanthobacteraceae bacterium]|nr:hypothetical protein [Xanthobacteraceae bacterium]